MNVLSHAATLFALFSFSAAAGQPGLAEIAAKLTPLKGTTPAQWRITWTGDATTEADISWSTAEAGERHVVHYGTSAHGADVKKYEHHQVCQENGAYGVAETTDPGFYHHAVLEGLKPAARYHFVLESDGEISRPFYFITAPAKGTDFSIIHGGDSRSGHLARCHINQMMAETVKKNPKIIAFAHSGDFIDNGHNWVEWRLWLSQHELTTGEDGRVLPVIPTRGNHDSGPIYKQVFNIAPSNPDWHTTRLGRDVAMVTLDTNVPGGGAQSEWLEAELKRLRPEVAWLLVQYHRPLYPAVKNAPAHKEVFAPLFDQYNVDLACESDGHCIKRTIPIRNDKPDPTGVVYIGEGGLGVGNRGPNTDLWYLKGGKVGSAHHIMRLDCSPQTLRIRTLLLEGEVFDDVSLKVRQ